DVRGRLHGGAELVDGPGGGVGAALGEGGEGVEGGGGVVEGAGTVGSGALALFAVVLGGAVDQLAGVVAARRRRSRRRCGGGEGPRGEQDGCRLDGREGTRQAQQAAVSGHTSTLRTPGRPGPSPRRWRPARRREPVPGRPSESGSRSSSRRRPTGAAW